MSKFINSSKYFCLFLFLLLLLSPFLSYTFYIHDHYYFILINFILGIFKINVQLLVICLLLFVEKVADKHSFNPGIAIAFFNSFLVLFSFLSQVFMLSFCISRMLHYLISLQVIAFHWQEKIASTNCITTY